MAAVRVDGVQHADFAPASVPQDFAAAGIFLNSVNHAQITYGGGQVIVNSQPQVFDPIHIISSRPTII